MEPFLCWKDSAGKWRWAPDLDCTSFLPLTSCGVGPTTPPLDLSSHLTSRDNDSSVNSLFLRGWNKTMCKIKFFRDLKTSCECVLAEEKIKAYLYSTHFWIRKFRVTGGIFIFSPNLSQSFGRQRMPWSMHVWLNCWLPTLSLIWLFIPWINPQW